MHAGHKAQCQCPLSRQHRAFHAQTPIHLPHACVANRTRAQHYGKETILPYLVHFNTLTFSFFLLYTKTGRKTSEFCKQ
jgi:hypothetical protein